MLFFDNTGFFLMQEFSYILTIIEQIAILINLFSPYSPFPSLPLSPVFSTTKNKNTLPNQILSRFDAYLN
jgi:hypothetical protein